MTNQAKAVAKVELKEISPNTKRKGKVLFFTLIKDYVVLGGEIKSALDKSPSLWQEYQMLFNKRVDQLYDYIYHFETELNRNSNGKLNRFRNIFSSRYRRYFLYGKYIPWCYEKPFGYAGDFKIIDDIYQNSPSSIGFARLWDNYFQQLAAPNAIRERKNDCKKTILNFVRRNKKRPLRIMNLASGAAREIKELLEEDTGGFFDQVTFDCIDFDQRALHYAQSIITNGTHKVNFLKRNAIRLALIKNIRRMVPFTYDFIYSLGLCDYLDDNLMVKLITNLKGLLGKEGILFISNAGERARNHSASWMEWVADWYLIYRPEDVLRKVFIDAGFSPESIQIVNQKSKVMQYCFARA